MVDLADLEHHLGARFEHPDLLRAALVHRSYVAEHHDAEHNERMEFLGDAVLQLVVTVYLFEHHRDLAEGEMAKVRAGLVNGIELAEVAREIDLGDHMVLGRGELASGGPEKESILADAMEAVIAAIYLDQGFEGARRFILERWADRIEARVAAPGKRDYKTRLQEVLAQVGKRPRYRITEQGPDHDKIFTAVVDVEGDIVGEGTGRSKKEAEQHAAARALEHGAV
ncbi:MAG: ribonuclease III [Acidimicrobiia bacterium]|nr:ribonuclease III [Acidimicrobiia bacterium]MDH3426673.1 ribonuclease III [Acidimicrobiia bacterium]MDH5615248.1 ribonuclease III [Acidimicrobiia bacterium]